MSKTIRSACRNKHEEQMDAFMYEVELLPMKKHLMRYANGDTTKLKYIIKWYKEYCKQRDTLGAESFCTFPQWLVLEAKCFPKTTRS